MRKFLLTCVLLLSPVLAWAQNHPCDQPAELTQTINAGAPYKLLLCHPQAEAILVTVDGTPFDLLAVVPKTPPSTTGWILYETTLSFLQLGKGTHIVTASVYGADGRLGFPSLPFNFVAVDDVPLPTAPVIRGVIRG